MISNQVLQNTLEGLKEISRTEFCVLDTEGKVLASTFADFSIATPDVQAFVESQADSQLVKGFQYFKVCDDYQLEYILVAHGDDEDTYMVGKLAAFQIQSLIVAYKERFDKDSFIKNLLLDNLLLVDIYNRAKKLHIEADVRRVVMILEMPQEKDHSSMESVKSLFGGKSKDFITAVDEKSIIVVKELEDGENYPEMDQLAHTILDTLGMGNDGKTHMAYGTIVNELKEVSRSYKEARMALDVGKIFFGNTGKIDDLIPSIVKHKTEKYLVPMSDVHNDDVKNLLDKNKIQHTEAVMYRTVSNDFAADEAFDYDMLVFFSPAGISALKKNFPDFDQKEIKIGTFGSTTAQAVRDAGLRLDLEAPSVQAPSMTAALDMFIKENNKGK